MTPTKLTIYIVDDEAPVRESLGRLLFMEGYVVQAFASGKAFLEEADVDGLGVLLLDLEMDSDVAAGKKVLQALNQRRSPLVVVFLSGRGKVSDVAQVMKEGVMDWLEKPWHPELFLETVKKAYARALQMSERLAERKHAMELWARLTSAEREVAPLVAKGLSSRDVGLVLEKNPRTVDTQRAEIFRKLELGNSNELQQFMMDNALVEKEAPK